MDNMQDKGPLELMLQAARLKPSECSCEQCRQKCTEAMCFGTPGDILNLINAGYKNFLKEVSAQVVMVNQREETNLKMIQLRYEDGCCVMYKDGRCLLHGTGLKPTEGRYYLHPADKHERMIMDHLTLSTVLEWGYDGNLARIAQCISKFRAK